MRHPRPAPTARPDSPSPTVAARVARALLAAAGWRTDIRWPPVPRCVIVVYPHTSNWDFVVGYLARLASALPVTFVGKHTLFRWPFRGLLRRMGGIPVNRADPAGIIELLEGELARCERLFLAIAPEGTRSYTDHWKSGFYRIALATGVPVGLAFIDYRTRTVGLSEYLPLTGDEEADLARIRAFYADKTAKHPEQASEIRFRSARAR
ncbi:MULTISPECIES: 1-acyl-sn-glycerol-3-phosphate acyltransferase [unclassified Anaeromyxobacter]|uniref:1-acyl-sn-glycerol-3-phosphate acyltransferase n=1 Tax=unclassified Anaeromyxobacter TaxID=2620896 RepID=UPI001F59449C|nr:MULTISPECIES: 1-acyl-sn-glycerol-3-phosphate acyltransferase [unclassified Anaeromyxobacter]